MSKIKYIFKRLKGLQWKQFWKMACKISKQEHKFVFFICIDMVLSAFLFGAGYMDYFEFEFYLLSYSERKTFLTAALNNKIIAKYNDKSKFYLFSDKVEFNHCFKKFIHRDFLDLESASFKQFSKFVASHARFIAKVKDSCGGKGIKIYSVEPDTDLQELYHLLKMNKQYLLEELICQDEEMNKLYSGSINSLRMITFVTDAGDVVLLNTVLRIGNGGEVDNFSSGGMYTFVDLDGKVLIPAIDEAGKVYKKHPITKTEFVGFSIPKFQEAVSYVKKLALVNPSVRYVGWDIAITKDGIDVIEGNEYSGVFQMKPSLSHQKKGLLPLYREYMDI